MMPNPTPAGRLNLTAFYVVVALIALAGQAIAAVTWLGWHWLPAVLAVAALEFGGIVLSMHADARRRIGEHANWARGLSAAVAGFAVAFNWLGHADHLQGGFFAGMSALGYGVWLLDSGARRRDQLRADGKLPPVAPAYGSIQWLRHPWLTRRARRLALVDPKLGLYGSLAAARAEVRRERRTAAISKVLHQKIRAVAPTMADIAVQVYDLDEIAARLAADADYDGLTALLAAELVPARFAALPVQEPAEVPVEAVDEQPMVAVEAEVEAEPEPAPVIVEPSPQPHRPRRLVLRLAGRRVVRVHRRRGHDRPPSQPTSPQPPRRPVEETRRYALALMAGDPALRRKDVAELLGITTRRLREILPAAETTSPVAGEA
jgi:hypothetical protein